MRPYRGLRVFLAALLLGASVSRLGATSSAELYSIQWNGRQALHSTDPESLKSGSMRGFDGYAAQDGYVSPPLVPKAREGSLTRRTGNLIVGTPGDRIREPRTPLTGDGKALTQRSGWLNRGLWTLGGAALGAGAGFLIAGPVGAAIGGVLGALAGLFFGP